MYIGSAVVQVGEGATIRVGEQLEQLEGVEVVGRAEQGLAVVIEADSPKQQKQLHDRVAGLSGVEGVSLVFQSSEVD